MRYLVLAPVLVIPAFITGCAVERAVELLVGMLAAPSEARARKEAEARREEDAAFPRREEARRIESLRAAYERERDRSDRGRCPVFYLELSPTQPGEILPTGRLCLGRNTVVHIDSMTRGAQLLINFDTRTAAGELSYVAEVRAYCDSDSLSVQSWRTFGQADAEGRTLDSRVSTAPIGITKPSKGLGEALKAICAL